MREGAGLATYKDLCIDAVDDLAIGRFWAGALGLDLEVRSEDDSVFLTGPTAGHRVWVSRVPEQVTVKQRVHLDVHVSAVTDLTSRGATVLDDTQRWTVLRDPEGGELCAFVRDIVPSYRLYELVVDCADADAMATWWGAVLGARVQRDREHGWSWLEEVPGMPFEALVFVPVPEPKTVKNRVHWDVDTESVAGLLDYGAVLVREQDEEIGWTVLADPEGNEFCAFTP